MSQTFTITESGLEKNRDKKRNKKMWLQLRNTSFHGHITLRAGDASQNYNAWLYITETLVNYMPNYVKR